MYNIRKKTNHPVFVCLFVYKLVNTSVNILFKKTSFERPESSLKRKFFIQGAADFRHESSHQGCKAGAPKT